MLKVLREETADDQCETTSDINALKNKVAVITLMIIVIENGDDACDVMMLMMRGRKKEDDNCDDDAITDDDVDDAIADDDDADAIDDDDENISGQNNNGVLEHPGEGARKKESWKKVATSSY